MKQANLSSIIEAIIKSILFNSCLTRWIRKRLRESGDKIMSAEQRNKMRVSVRSIDKIGRSE